MRQLDHVDQFLWHMDTRGAFLTIAEQLAETARQDAEIRQNLSAIGAWAQKQSDLLSQQVARTEISGDILGGPAEATLLAVSYQRAQAALQAHATNIPTQPSELQKAVANTRRALDTLEPDFITRLLIETERRASRDPMFANRLNEAKQDLRWLGGQLLFLPELDVTQTSQTKGPELRAGLGALQRVSNGAIVILVLVFLLGFLAGGADGSGKK